MLNFTPPPHNPGNYLQGLLIVTLQLVEMVTNSVRENKYLYAFHFVC